MGEEPGRLYTQRGRVPFRLARVVCDARRCVLLPTGLDQRVHVHSMQSAISHELAARGLRVAVGDSHRGGGRGLTGALFDVADTYNAYMDPACRPSLTLWRAMLVGYIGGVLRFGHYQLECCDPACRRDGVRDFCVDGIGGGMGIRGRYLHPRFGPAQFNEVVAASAVAGSELDLARPAGDAGEPAAGEVGGAVAEREEEEERAGGGREELRAALRRPAGESCMLGMLVDRAKLQRQLGLDELGDGDAAESDGEEEVLPRGGRAAGRGLARVGGRRGGAGGGGRGRAGCGRGRGRVAAADSPLGSASVLFGRLTSGNHSTFRSYLGLVCRLVARPRAYVDGDSAKDLAQKLRPSWGPTRPCLDKLLAALQCLEGDVVPFFAHLILKARPGLVQLGLVALDQDKARDLLRAANSDAGRSGARDLVDRLRRLPPLPAAAEFVLQYGCKGFMLASLRVPEELEEVLRCDFTCLDGRARAAGLLAPLLQPGRLPLFFAAMLQESLVVGHERPGPNDAAAVVVPLLARLLAAVRAQRSLLRQQQPARVYTALGVQAALFPNDAVAAAEWMSASWTGAFFAGAPLPRRLPQVHAADAAHQRKAEQTCSKPSFNRLRFAYTGSLMIYTCAQHQRMVGFQFNEGGESPLEVWRFLHTHAPSARRVVYDMACRLHVSALRRRPVEALGMQFKHDSFHRVNHECSDAYDPKLGDEGVLHENTSIAENINAAFGKLCNSVRGSNCESATKLLKFAMAYWQPSDRVLAAVVTAA